MKNKIQKLADKYHPEVVRLRRHIHANPELSWQEFETSKLVADTLLKIGLQVETNVASNGVVAILRGKNPDLKCIALRADMDALPITEKNEVAYCSKIPGVMHACGHDVHTSNLLGVAMILSELKHEIDGTFKFIFQPSEEKIPSGAKAMIESGVLENPVVDKILGMHVSPELESGTFGFCPGPFMASSDEIYITVIGKGGHAARIEELKNPLLIAAEILLELKTLTNPQIPIVLSFGKIEGKGATNIVPDVVEIEGTLRCFDENLRMQLHKQIETICQWVSEKYLTQWQLNIVGGSPVLHNNIPLTIEAKTQAQFYVGKDSVFDLPVRLGSEDFAYYTHKIPACFYRLGVGNKKIGITSGIHTPTFNIDETALQHSTGMMAWLALTT